MDTQTTTPPRQPADGGLSRSDLLAVGDPDDRFFRLEKDGEYAGCFYRSEIEPYPWMMSRGCGVIDMDFDRDALAKRRGVILPANK
jgi:hypothetical protein